MSRRFPGMLLSPSPFRSRSAIRSRDDSSHPCPLRGRYNAAPRGAPSPCADPRRSSLPSSTAPSSIVPGGRTVAVLPNSGSASVRFSFEPHHGETRRGRHLVLKPDHRETAIGRRFGSQPVGTSRTLGQNPNVHLLSQLGGYCAYRASPNEGSRADRACLEETAGSGLLPGDQRFLAAGVAGETGDS
jgi:hypothetical protein